MNYVLVYTVSNAKNGVKSFQIQ